MTLTKAQIVETIAKRNGFAKNRSIEILGTLLEIIKHALESGDDVLVSGFGKNPVTGEDLLLSARKVVTFKYSGKLKDKINRESPAR